MNKLNNNSSNSNKMEGAEKRISEFRDIFKEFIQSEENREIRLEKKEESNRNLWDYKKGSNSCVIRGSERREKEGGSAKGTQEK